MKLAAWAVAWTFVCRWTPKPANPLRLLVLRLFGAKVGSGVFVHQRSRIQIPWNLVLEDRSCIGDSACLYSLANITVGAGAVIAQEAYICGGTHDFDDPKLPLVVAPIRIGAKAFIGARAFVLPGISIGDSAIVGACSVVTKDVGNAVRVAGNPAKRIGR